MQVWRYHVGAEGVILGKPREWSEAKRRWKGVDKFELFRLWDADIDVNVTKLADLIKVALGAAKVDSQCVQGL
jgi:hypothetical protein